MYAFAHNSMAYGPDGPIKDVEGTPLEAKDSDEYNRQVEAQELEHIKTGPDRLMIYIVKPKDDCIYWSARTWLETFLGNCWLGPRQIMGFQSRYIGGSYRRAVTVRIFGTLYHGWYFESSGSYARLKKAKKQQGAYAATS